MTRFAPSPTGELHLGHVYHALWLWGVARQHGATVLLRMEDHDRTRCRPEFERSILGDLEWLGFEADSASRVSLDTRPSAFRQSDHPERYQHASEILADLGLLYGCNCPRAALSSADSEHRCRTTARCRTMPVVDDGGHVVRAVLPGTTIIVNDLRLGERQYETRPEVADVTIRDRLGQWTYQFCVVVDDLHDGVNLIVRGEDLAESTGRQWALAALLGRREPFRTLHHPLLYASDGKKLSKRDRSEAVSAMRARGMTPVDVIAAALGAHSPRTASDRPPGF